MGNGVVFMVVCVLATFLLVAVCGIVAAIRNRRKLDPNPVLLPNPGKVHVRFTEDDK